MIYSEERRKNRSLVLRLIQVLLRSVGIEVALTTFLILLIGCREKADLMLAVGGAPSEIDYWEKLINEFEAKTNIKVKLLRQPTDTDQRRQGLVIPLKAKKSDPDVFLMDVAWVGQFSASDWLMNLSPYIRESFDTTKLFSSILNQVDVHKGNIVALPVYIDCGLLYFREDLIKKYKCSIPETWDELLNCAIKVQEGERNHNPHFYGFVWQGAQYEGLICNFIEFIASNNGKILSPEGNIVLTSQENIEALQFMCDIIHKHKISPPNTFTEMKEEEVRAFFETGNALFERNWPYAWKLHQSNASPVKGRVGVTILPRFALGNHTATLGGWHIGVSKYSDTKTSAWQLVQFILSYETQKKLALNLGWNPARKDIYDDPELKQRLPHIKILKTAFEHSVARPNLPYWTQISDILQKYVNAAISGKLAPQSALQYAQSEIEKLIKRYH